ncbi:MAG: ATP-binding cassette domain-containing protein [Clostridia bacterium]
MIAVNLNQLSKKYGRRIGISGIDLIIQEGEIFGLIGPDGAGKTTVLRILMNYILPSDGEAEVFDMDVTDEAKEIKRDTVYVPGEIYFYHKMKAGKYINLMLKSHRRKKDERLQEIIRVFEIDVKERFEDMDRSDQKKLALAAAIAVSPRLLLLDEPLRGLDANIQSRLFDYLLELQDQGTTIVITGRDVDEIASICNRIAIIENGEITVTPEEFAAENPDFREIPRPVLTEDDFEDDFPGSDLEDTAPIGNMEDTIVIIPAVKEEAPAKAEEIPDEELEEPAEDTIPTEEMAEKEPVKEEQKPAENKKQKEKKKETTAKKHTPKEKNITIKSIGFQRDAFEAIGAEIISEEGNKIIMEYSGDLGNLAKLLYDLNMDDICISSKDLQEEFLPFYEGGGKA